MPSDLTTVEEVEAGEYTVRVAQVDDGSGYEAVVLSKSSDSSDQLMTRMIGPKFTLDTSSDTEVSGTPVTATHRWLAIGLAIEVHKWDDEDITPETADLMVDGVPIGQVSDMTLSLDRTGLDPYPSDEGDDE